MMAACTLTALFFLFMCVFAGFHNKNLNLKYLLYGDGWGGGERMGGKADNCT